MKFTKQKITEIIDGDGNLMGGSDEPETGANKSTQANKTTDYNVRVSGQNFKNDFLGRFGFYFYEGENGSEDIKDLLAKLMYAKFKETLEWYKENPENIEKDYELHKDATFESQPEDKREHDYRWADEVMTIIKPFLKDKLNESAIIDEDKIKDKKNDSSVKSDKKSNDLMSSKINKVAEILAKLPNNKIDKLISLLEKHTK